MSSQQLKKNSERDARSQAFPAPEPETRADRLSVSRLVSLFTGDSTRARLTRRFLPVIVGILIIENWVDTTVAATVTHPVFANFLTALSTIAVAVVAVSCVSKRVGNSVDDASRKSEQTLQALHASENKFRGLSEHSLAGMYVIQDGRFTYVNPRFARIFGYNRDEIIGLRVEELIVEADRVLVLDSIRKRAAEASTTSHYTFRGLRKDGTTVDVEVYGSSAEDNGRPAVIGTLLDVTERKNADQRLREVSTLYEKTLSSLNEAVFISDPVSRTISRCNDTAERMFGYSREEIVGRDTRFLHLNDDRYREFGSHMMNAVREGKPVSFPFKLRCKNGEIFDSEHFITPLFDEERKLLGVVSVVRDVTERLRGERVVQDANERFTAVLDSLDAFVYVTDMETHEVLFTNKFGRDLFGDIVGKICYRALHAGATEPCSFCSNARLLDPSGKPAGTSSWDLQDPKSGRWYHIRDRAITWTDGRVVKLAIATDITDRKKTENLLLETERRFREIFENVQLVAISIDCNGSITFCNDFMLRLTGYRKEELAGKNWFGLLVPQDEKARDMFLEAGCVGGMPLHHEYQIVTKEGEPRTISWNNILLRDVDGAVIGMASLGEDITTRKRLEAQLLHSQKMESIGTLAGGIAHDFNNILTAIIGFGNVLSRKLSEDDPLAFYVDQILDAAESAANLTRSLLAFGRKQIMNSKPQDLNRIVENLERILKRIIGEDIEFTTGLEQGPLEIMADFGRMEQVLMNLAANARDAMPSGGSLTIRTSRVHLGNEFTKMHGYGMPGEYALLAIADTGTGMDEKTRERVFEPFFTTKEVNKGTGLGLSIVYGIVKQHKGYIAIDSAPGRGTTVNVYFPILTAKSGIEHDTGRTAAIPPGAKGRETVLIAEDDRQIRELVSTQLTESGYTIIVAEDGEEALHLAGKEDARIDLFLLDVVMPRKNGIEVYANIVKTRPDAKVLFVSGYAPDLFDGRAAGIKGFDFLAKPVAPLELLNKVREVLDRPGAGENK